MKKRLIALFMCMTMVVSMTACGGDRDSVENTEDLRPITDLAKYEFNYADYVTLCEYIGIPVELAEDYTITEDDVTNYVDQIFSYYGPFYGPDETKTVVSEGDIVNVDYVGKLDGVAFDGGTASNQNIDVSGNRAVGGTGYIDGFTDGLMGATVGTQVDCDVTFPENYGSADLAGKAVVFTFTVNSIQKEITPAEMDDAFALENFGEESVEAFYDYIREGLVITAENYKRQDAYPDIQQYLTENCEVEIPSEYFADLMKASNEYFVAEYCGGDESQLIDFLCTNYGYTAEEAEESWKNDLMEIVQVEFILGLLAEKLNITLDTEAFDAYMDEYAAYYGLESKEVLYEEYGFGDIAYGEKMAKAMYVQSDVLGALMETAVITIAEPIEESIEVSTELSTEEVVEEATESVTE